MFEYQFLAEEQYETISSHCTIQNPNNKYIETFLLRLQEYLSVYM